MVRLALNLTGPGRVSLYGSRSGLFVSLHIHEERMTDPHEDYHEKLDLRFRSGRAAVRHVPMSFHPRMPRLTVAGLHAERHRIDAWKALYRVLIRSAVARYRAAVAAEHAAWCAWQDAGGHTNSLSRVRYEEAAARLAVHMCGRG